MLSPRLEVLKILTQENMLITLNFFVVQPLSCVQPNTRCLHGAQLDSHQPFLIRKEGRHCTAQVHLPKPIKPSGGTRERSTTHPLRLCPNKHSFFIEDQTRKSQPALYHHKGTLAPPPGAVSSATLGNQKLAPVPRRVRSKSTRRITQGSLVL